MDLRERHSASANRHPWETVRARFFCGLLVSHLPNQSVNVLDIGAGDGYVASALLAQLPIGSTVTCVDSEYTDDVIAALREGAPAGLQFSRTIPDQQFDAIMMLDVLEHVADDGELLSNVARRRLRPRGFLLASVPAHQSLFTQHDVVLGHQRRYSANELVKVTVSAGLEPRLTGSLFGSLIVPRAIAKAVEYARGIRSRPNEVGLSSHVSTGINTWSHGPLVTGVVRGALALDARLCELAAKWRMPSSGLSVWTLSERTRPEAAL